MLAPREGQWFCRPFVDLSAREFIVYGSILLSYCLPAAFAVRLVLQVQLQGCHSGS